MSIELVPIPFIGWSTKTISARPEKIVELAERGGATSASATSQRRTAIESTGWWNLPEPNGE